VATRTISKQGVALIVVDMQNGFCHPSGSFAKIGLDITMCSGAIEGCKELIECARAFHMPIVFTRYVYQPGYTDGGVLVNELLPAIKDVNSLAANSWDAEIVDKLKPSPGEVVIDKSRYSAFYGTRLEPLLTSLGIKELVVCGVTTNMCVESTARDASQRDYRVFVVRDATGELDRARHDHALFTIGFGFGWVVDTQDVLHAWR
jgi:ureidoacrylate peracid hydrolase